MIVVASAILGALFGAMTAKKRGGAGKDVAQYSATYALIFLIIGVFISVVLSRMAG